MKKYLFIALAALGFAACSEKFDETKSPSHNGEIEESYIAINLMAADSDTRAQDPDNEKDGGYEYGTVAERAVKSAYFFFFDEAGKPFSVTANADNQATAPGTVDGKNHLSLTIGETTGKTDPNVSDIKKAVLILSTYKGVYPSKIVAVLNWTPVGNQSYSLEQLHEALATIGNDNNGYVMSNSVYMDGAGMMVNAVPLIAANIKTTPEAAMAAPVDIYVERTAAKVVLTASKGTKVDDYVIFDTQKSSTPVPSTGTSSKIDVYVKLHGWELYNDYATSHLLKNIENWDVATLGLTWNDIPYYRCYWAKSQDTDHSDKFAWSYTDEDKSQKGFKTNYGFGIASIVENKIVDERSTYTYCGENTNQAEKDGEGKITSDPRTKVILKGQLMQKNGDNYEPLELARWYGTEYAGNEALRIAVANSLKYTLFYYDEGSKKHIGITPEDLQCVEGTKVGAEAYEVGFQLSNTEGKGTNREWFKYDSKNGYVTFGTLDTEGVNASKTNEYLKNVEPALLYASGQTYYHIDIKHLGATGKTAEYGVVRNHVYQIDVESITGYGSPVYNEHSNLENPDYPQLDESSYVAARINVLSWKVVKQGVNIQQ